ncbi:recombinase family protein [uncultured Microscilla sp.]|uniref:recombinase family protein n=1 Tax=uncultured Microscilla sp. TaxID=432653 RepID=UPI0026058706|nr:recombinase family protein [uncultured Microscilla sp.]
MKVKYVAYYRVSTRQQGISGLGLGAQKKAAKDFVQGRGGALVKEFEEIESGRRTDRPVLEEAMTLCKKEGNILLVAKLDRLARNLGFLTRLMESGLKFQCCDMPEVDNFTIHILGAVAQKEREATSERTKLALAEKKRRIAQGDINNVKPSADGRTEMKPDKQGKYRLGSPKGWTDEHREKAKQAIQNKAAGNEATRKARLIIDMCIKQGMNNREIADYLNELGMRTARGKAFTRNNVRYLM